MPPRHAPLQVLRGFCMGAADIVPGVSGGTVALVLGIYTTLVHQVRQGARTLGTLARGQVRGSVREAARIDWWFLLPLLAGVVLALVTLASVISHFLEDQPVRTAAVFFGLVVGSLVTTVQLVHDWHRANTTTAALAAVVTFVVLGFGSGQVHDPPVAFVFLGGAIAICAMILPGVSGSFLLLMIGLYKYVLDAVDERDLAVIAVFGAGAVVGLSLFSSLLSWALHRHEQRMLAVLIGLLVGSLRVLWPWPNGTGSEESTDGAQLALPAGDVWWPIALAVGAAVVIVGVSRVAGANLAIEHRTHV